MAINGKYKVIFLDKENNKSTVIVDNLSKIKEGFWTDKNQNYTNTSSAQTWIPPGRLICVEKIN